MPAQRPADYERSRLPTEIVAAVIFITGDVVNEKRRNSSAPTRLPVKAFTLGDSLGD